MTGRDARLCDNDGMGRVSVLVCLATVLPAAGCGSKSLIGFLDETERIEIRENSFEGEGRWVTIEEKMFVRRVIEAAQTSLEPTGKAAGYRPTHHLRFVARDGTETRAMIAVQLRIFSIAEPGQQAVTDRTLSPGLETALTPYLKLASFAASAAAWR